MITAIQVAEVEVQAAGARHQLAVQEWNESLRRYLSIEGLIPPSGYWDEEARAFEDMQKAHDRLGEANRALGAADGRFRYLIDPEAALAPV